MRNSLLRTACATACFIFTLINLQAADVGFYAVLKGQLFIQNSSGAPVPSETSNVVFQAEIDVDEGSLTNAIVVLPNSTQISLSGEDEHSDELGFEQSFDSTSAMNAAFPDGTYTMILQTVNDGNRTNTLTFSGGYPATPRISNFDAAQAVNPEQPFTLTWDALAGGTVDDFVMLQIRACSNDEDDHGEEVFYTPDLGEPGALNGTATSAIIPARTLRPGQTYKIEMLIGRGIPDTSSYPGATGLAAYFKRLQSQLTTTGTHTGCPRGELRLWFGFPQGYFSGTNGFIGFPTGLDSFFASFNIRDDSYPTNVFFTGPAGSGLTNTPSENYGSSEDSYWYNTPSIFGPVNLPGGLYTVNYKGSNVSWNLLDPQADEQQVIIVPTAVLGASNVLQEVRWTFKDTNGNSIPQPAFISRIDLQIEGDFGRIYDASTEDSDNEFPLNATNHALAETVFWTDVSRVYLIYRDAADHQYGISWQRSTGSLQINTVNPAGGIVGAGYSSFLNASGGTFQYTWSLESGSLPDGLSLNGSTGEIHGTPTQTGTNQFTVKVTDSALNTATKSFAIVVTGGNPVPYILFAGKNLSGNFEMLVQGIPSRTYSFEWSATLTTNSWLQLATAGSNPTNGVIYFQDTSPNQSFRFYRAALLP